MSLDAPIARKLTYDDYVLIPDDGQRHEIVDGVPIVNPAPNPRHQLLVGEIYVRLRESLQVANAGQVLLSPIDVALAPHDIVQPDLVVIASARSAIILPSHIRGVPDLLVEILSPSSTRLDRVLKKERYARAGVPEYWIVDPTQRIVERYLLREGDYELQPEAPRVALSCLPAVEIDLTQIW